MRLSSMLANTYLIKNFLLFAYKLNNICKQGVRAAQLVLTLVYISIQILIDLANNKGNAFSFCFASH